ncbi:MAG TPA: EAL domain-containing protein [Aromatoleum sp.]|uniref:EAL domain-containing protein n=1 Tax=Aromatoleum sp. TaxID=2307007 RepID=UPI002B46A52D|nr:EAL domain-containing protein [Aromatoleum sp.]HJV24326.1 EAL domain-containing protein [Aromatoleum sp.]
MTDKKTIADLASARDKLERLTRLYAMLSRINRSIVRLDDPYELYENTCRMAVEEGGFLFAWIGLFEPGGTRMQAVARAGAPVEFARVGAGAAESTDGWSASGAVIREGRPCIVNEVDVELSPASPWKGILREVGARSAAALPLMMENAVAGVLVVGAEKPGCFLDAELQLLNEVAEDISFALRVMRREEERLAAETKIQYLAYYDAETGLPGRALLAERLAAAGERIVLAVSLRRYHAILQALGQAAGVQLARTVAARLESLLPTAAVGRFNPSEFGCLLQPPEGLHAVEEIAWQLHQGLAEPFLIDGSEVFLDPFVGIAMHPLDGDAAQAIDAAVLAAGTGAKGASGFCRFFVAGMDGGSRHQLDVEAALRRALERGELELHYQPQVDVASGRVVGAEALLRWQRPGHGLVLPSQFIPMLEATGLIVPVGEWVIAEACASAKRWQAEGLMPFRMAVNLSARQFQSGDVGELVRRSLADTGLEHRWLELEVTESAVLLNADAVIRTLNELKSQGVSHALDDFGTGYSSLSYLQRLPVSRIKIDQSFVAGVTSNPQSAAIVRAVVGMAHSLKLTVIAEGVETDGQLAFLRGLGCEEIQGFYFSRALPGDEFAALLRENRCIPPAQPMPPPERVLLVVDDEAHVLSALRRSLRHSDFRVLTATGALEGFERLASHPVGVVLCDQRMTEMTGTEFLRRVRDLYPGVVRIVLSGYTDLTSVIDAVNRGAIFKFMTKPWDDAALLECLQDAFRLHEIDRQNRELSLRLDEVTGSGR